VIELDAFARKNQTPSTAALSLLYAADVQLARIRVEGMESRWARHSAMRERVMQWTLACQAAGSPVAILAPKDSRSPTVGAITLPDGITGDTVVNELGSRGFTVGTGYGTLRHSTFRIGHKGEHQPDGLIRLQDACSHVLADLQ
jgi:aspartate aminotransferase-like enzyme